MCFIGTNLETVSVDFSDKPIKIFFNVAVDSFITVNDNDMCFVNRYQENGARVVFKEISKNSRD